MTLDTNPASTIVTLTTAESSGATFLETTL